MFCNLMLPLFEAAPDLHVTGDKPAPLYVPSFAHSLGSAAVQGKGSGVFLTADNNKTVRG